MSEFERQPAPNNLFEGVNEVPVELYLRKRDQTLERFNRNENNELRFQQVTKILNEKPILCYFQKQKDNQKGNARHRILIKVGEEKGVEIIVGLHRTNIDDFTEVYSYYILKIKEVSIFNPPSKDVEKRICKIEFIEEKENRGTQDEEFKNLYQAIEKLPIPVIDLNKEKDRNIWNQYVNAIKKLTKQKEQIWKIKEVSRPYTQSKNKGKDRATYIDFFIDEKKLEEQFEKTLLNQFNEADLEDYGVISEKAFIEFKKYRELSEEELERLKELGQEYFYELSEDSPIHFISGLVSFPNLDDDSNEELFAEIETVLNEDYQLKISIDGNGVIKLEEKEIPFLEKFILDNYSDFITLEKENLIELDVKFLNKGELKKCADLVKTKLNQEGLNKALIHIDESNNQLEVEVSSYIWDDKFREEGLAFVKNLTRFVPPRGNRRRLKPIQDWEIHSKNNEYYKFNATKEDIEKFNSKLIELYNRVRFIRLPSIYFFKPIDKKDLTVLRNFKLSVDRPSQVEFNIIKSQLIISPENRREYELLLTSIAEKFPSAKIQKKQFQSTFKLKSLYDDENKRIDIFNKFQNSVMTKIIPTSIFNPVKNNTELYFEIPFNDEQERDRFKQNAKQFIDEIDSGSKIKFDSQLGRTLFEFKKNETLEWDKEKETIKNVRRATFIYLTEPQKLRLEEEIKEHGIDERFRGGMTIGNLMRKDKTKLTFKIDTEFDEKLTARKEERLDLKKLSDGYIKPIFPGELINIGRMVRAMEKVTSPGERRKGYKIGFPVNRNLPNFLFDPSEARIPNVDMDELKQDIVGNLNEPLLGSQPKQLEAVAKSITARDLALIQGPPGTGKTTVIAEIVWQILRKNPDSKILITSQTNLAVDNALGRLTSKNLVRPLRIGKMEKLEDEGKVYSNSRINDWLKAKSESAEEEENQENAVHDWLNNIVSNSSQEEKYSNIIDKWKNRLKSENKKIKEIFSEAYYKYVNVFAATCSECGSRNFSTAYQNTFFKHSERRQAIKFDVVIMDEASKATPPELILPLISGKKVIIIGDHKQLPPMINENEFSEALEAVGARELIEDWTKDDYKISQFEKLFKNAPKQLVASLDTQFRMHGQIMDCISQFYKDQEELENGLICGIKEQMNISDFSNKASRWHGLKLVPFIEPNNHAIWVNVSSPEEKVGTSYKNFAEVDAIKTVLRAMKKSEGFQEYHNYFQKDEDKEIGIITYYTPQMEEIKKSLYPQIKGKEWKKFERLKFNNEFQIPFKINTVDRFQGMERNIIIISTVRSDIQIKDGVRRSNKNYPFALGFARELQRVNVGFSRAKRLLIVVGNQKHFSQKPEYAKSISNMHQIDIKQLQNIIR